MRKIFFTLFAFLFFSQTIYAASYDPKIEWETIKTDHFKIHFDQKIDNVAKKIAVYLEEAYRELSPKMGWKPWGRTEVVVSDNTDSANGMASTIPYNWMQLYVAAPDIDSALADYDNWLRTLCFHEYSHILNIDQYGGVLTVPRYILGKVVSPNGTVPGWMREGLPTFNETEETTKGRGRATYSEMLLRTAILEGKFPAIDEADGLQWKWPSYQSMYIYGVKFLEYLKGRYGEESVLEFQKKMAKSPLFYAVNHQAKKVFNKPAEFESVKVNNHYSKRKVEGTPTLETFYDLWRDWKVSLNEKYSKEKESLEKEAVSDLKFVAGGETILGSPVISRDGTTLIYGRSRVKSKSEIHKINLSTGENKILLKGRLPTQISVSPDGEKIVYSELGSYKRYYRFNDLHLLTLKDKKMERLTVAKRAADPDFSPDGKSIIFVQQDHGQSWLSLIDLESKEITELNRGNDFAQFANPRWSPDGKKVVVSSWQPDGKIKAKDGFEYNAGRWDLYLFDVSSKKLTRLTDDDGIDSRPSWSSDGKEIYYSSDKTGVSNIYKLNLATKKSERLTNVLTGAFMPTVAPDGKTLYVQYYNGDGFDIRSLELSSKEPYSNLSKNISLTKESSELKAPVLDDVVGMDLKDPKKYSPFDKSLFLPRFIVPNLATLDTGVLLSVMTGSADPLRRHNWLGGLLYRTDLSHFLGYYFDYSYNRYRPVLNVGIVDYALNFGNIGFASTGNSYHLYEKRRRVYGSVAYPWERHVLSLQYFWEVHRPAISLLPVEYDQLNFGNFGGFSIGYGYSNARKYPSSISPENGTNLRANFTITDKWLGTAEKNEQRIFAGDLREYVSLPWANHILALRTAGGITWGDQLVQGTFSFGGTLGGGIFGGGDSLYYFPFRGIPIASLVKERALLFSAEYRIPFFSPQRGLGTLPFYIQNIHLAPFVDYGNAWDANANMWGDGKYFFNDFLMSTGAEVRGDFILGHGLPVSGRIGYGIVVVNRDRLGNVKDPILKTSIKNGILVLQLGTAF